MIRSLFLFMFFLLSLGAFIRPAHAQAQHTDSFESAAAAVPSELPQLSCMVDTTGYDEFTPLACIGFDFGGPRSAKAVFRVDHADLSTHQIIWDHLNCSGYQCITPLTAYRSKSLSVTVIDHNSGEQWVLQAQAVYENGY